MTAVVVFTDSVVTDWHYLFCIVELNIAEEEQVSLIANGVQEEMPKITQDFYHLHTVYVALKDRAGFENTKLSLTKSQHLATFKSYSKFA